MNKKTSDKKHKYLEMNILEMQKNLVSSKEVGLGLSAYFQGSADCSIPPALPVRHNIIYPSHLDKIYKSSPSHTTPMENNAKLRGSGEINRFSLKCHNCPLFGRGAYFIEDKMGILEKLGVD